MIILCTYNTFINICFVPSSWHVEFMVMQITLKRNGTVFVCIQLTGSTVDCLGLVCVACRLFSSNKLFSKC